MATIPLGNFGNAIAGAAPRVNIPRVNIPREAFDTGGAGLQQMGESLTRAGASMLSNMREEENQLTKAKLANAALDREIELDAIGTEIDAAVSSGQVSYKDADKIYKDRVGKLKTPEELKTADPVTAENFNRQLKRLDFKGASRVEGIVAKAQQGEMRSSVDGMLDKLGKKAGLPGSDMSVVTSQVSAMDEIGRKAYGAGWEKRKQDWLDNSWNARLNQEAMLSRDSLQSINELQKRITEGDYSDKLDSDKRNTLVAKLDGYKTSLIQRQEAAASRAARQQEVVMRRAEAEFNTFQSLSDKGTILSPEYIERAYQMTAGTPYQAGISALAQQVQETGGLASQPISRQREMLTEVDRMIAQRGRSPELDKRREQISKVLAASETDVKREGIRAGLERGVVTDVTPIDISSPEAISNSIIQRMQQADMVSAWNGRPVSPLDSTESDQLRDMLTRLPAAQRSQAISTISQTVGPKYSQAIAQQLDEKDRPLALAFASAGTMTSAGRYTSELILKGAAAAKDGLNIRNAFGVAKNDVKAQIAEQINTIPMVDERAAQSVKDAAYYITLSMAQEEGSVSGSDIDRAIRLAIGGNVIDRNGKSLPIPANMDGGEFEKRLSAITANDIARQAPGGKVRAAGVEIDAQTFAASLPGQELSPVSPGRYMVMVGGRPVVNAKGTPIIVKVD